MQLDKKERLQFIFQLKILDKLYPDEGYGEQVKALEEGYELHYSWLIENLSDGLSFNDCREVLDILGVYRAMIFSYKRLDDKDGINEELLKFPGFDGNSETSRMFYVQYFLDDLKRFKEIKDISLSGYNSHTELLPKYRNLLNLYNSLQHEKGGLINRDNLLRLLEIAPTGF